jgi:MFS family permease
VPRSQRAICGRDAAVNRDIALLFVARGARMFGYGSVAVLLVLYLARLGLDGGQIGLLLTLTLLGNALVSLWLTTRADRIGRRKVLVAGSVLMVVGGIGFAATDAFAVLLVAATIGVISASGGEAGPFQAVEQAAVSQTLATAQRTRLFAWYTLVGLGATAAGSLATGVAASAMIAAGLDDLLAYRIVLGAYALLGLALIGIFSQVSPAVEAKPSGGESRSGRLGLHRSRGVVLRLAGLFVMDSFGTGLALQSFVAYWFHTTYGVGEATLGAIFFAGNVLAAASTLAAPRIAARIGLVNTMVFTHLPSNLFLVLVPLMPTLELAVAALMLRFSTSQMDVPTKQSYMMAVVDPDERSAAAGIAGIARIVGLGLAMPLAAPLYTTISLAALPFLVAGGLKATYDLLLWRAFRKQAAPGERVRAPAPPTPAPR